jgi:hypothetical protein
MMLSLAVYPSVESQLRQDEMKDQPVILTPSEYLDFLADIQRYGKLPALKARYQILNIDYETAEYWLEICLSIRSQITVHSNSHIGTTATDQAAGMFRQVELWVQTPDSPGLYRSLQDLPRPFLKVIDFKPLVQMESKQRYARNQMFEVASNLDMPDLVEEANDLLPDCTSEQFERMSRQVDRFVAILECLEGLRYYAALYDGVLPDTLDEVTELRLPTDPVTNGIFVYYKESNNYILRTSDADIIPATLGFGYTIRMTPISKDKTMALFEYRSCTKAGRLMTAQLRRPVRAGTGPSLRNWALRLQNWNKPKPLLFPSGRPEEFLLFQRTAASLTTRHPSGEGFCGIGFDAGSTRMKTLHHGHRGKRFGEKGLPIELYVGNGTEAFSSAVRR